MLRTAFFGGSFDPPHWGHKGVADGVLASGRSDRILWVPAFAPPHKLGRERAPFMDRLTMVKLLIAGDSRQEVSDIEYRRRRVPSYTAELLETLEEELKAPFQLLIGADSLRELHTWHRAQEIAERFEVLTYPRPECPVSREVLEEHWSSALAEKLLRGFLPGKIFEISSTNLRFSMAKSANRSHIIYMTPPSVAEYCRRHQLYGAKK